MGDPHHPLRCDNYANAKNRGSADLPVTGMVPWSLLDEPSSYGYTRSFKSCDTNASEKQESAVHNTEDSKLLSKRRPSVLRLFTGLSRFRRANTDEASSSGGNISDPLSSTALRDHKESDVNPAFRKPSEDAEESKIQEIARNEPKLGSIMRRIAGRLPSPAGRYHDDQEAQRTIPHEKLPTTLRAAVRVFSEIVQLSHQEHDEFWVAVEVECILHNRVLLPDSTVDVIVVVDNGYYVSKDCLGKALDAVYSTLYYLRRGDRIALYTTHCTHRSVTGNRPDLLFPLGPIDSDIDDIFRDLVSSIAKCGTQTWKPPRPNPSMADVILGIAKSLEGKNLKDHRTRILVLSPASHKLHEVSKSYPNLFIHQINPGAIPYRRRSDTCDEECSAWCCESVSLSNWTHVESIPSCIKRILNYARSERPAGQISRVSIDIRARDGCEVIESLGTKDLTTLRLGQIHTVFIRVRTSRSVIKAVDLLSSDPVFNSSLDVRDLRQQLRNAESVGAVKAHLLDVQVFHQNTLHERDCWNYTETPLLIVSELGRLAPPLSTAYEVHKRRLFHIFAHVQTEMARDEADAILSAPGQNQEPLKKLVHRMSRQADHNQQVSVYEQECRQKLPTCPGPVDIEASQHEWLIDLWNRKMTKRQGVTM
ncbi:hypothetical protein E8E13_009066 [Curvularia kusanoi]|uniref:Uncharacterized protein n=1 Tax=Curvularia kusanoi TaxID=90978 RepID=A0A9P4TK35_CURKU|nr:hypothetical protein E8E13_009066 [Curvularia kusanoi]